MFGVYVPVAKMFMVKLSDTENLNLCKMVGYLASQYRSWQHVKHKIEISV